MGSVWFVALWMVVGAAVSAIMVVCFTDTASDLTRKIPNQYDKIHWHPHFRVNPANQNYLFLTLSEHTPMGVKNRGAGFRVWEGFGLLEDC